MECQCCFSDVPTNATTTCSLGCLFCIACVRTYVSVELNKGNTVFPCVSSSSCAGHVGTDRDTRVLGVDLLRAVDRTEANNNIRSAHVGNLHTCPVCPFVAIYDPVVDGTIFMCQSPDCNAITCSLCMKPAHWDEDCAVDDRVERRKRQEESENGGVIKACPSCNVGIVKDHGCNRVKCRCGRAMCWVCGTDIPARGYSHFSSAPGRCVLFEDCGSDGGGGGEVRPVEAAGRAHAHRQPRQDRVRACARRATRNALEVPYQHHIGLGGRVNSGIHSRMLEQAYQAGYEESMRTARIVRQHQVEARTVNYFHSTVHGYN